MLVVTACIHLGTPAVRGHLSFKFWDNLFWIPRTKIIHGAYFQLEWNYFNFQGCPRMWSLWAGHLGTHLILGKLGLGSRQG